MALFYLNTDTEWQIGYHGLTEIMKIFHHHERFFLRGIRIVHTGQGYHRYISPETEVEEKGISINK